MADPSHVELAAPNDEEQGLLRDPDSFANSVTGVMKIKVPHGKKEEFDRWMAEMNEINPLQPGFVEREVLRLTAVPNGPEDVVIILRYDSYENLRYWLISDIRVI